MIIIYDITRLYVRRNECTPTGIDRVDINYLRHFIENENEIIFVRGEKGELKIFPLSQAIEIIKKLFKLWLGEELTRKINCRYNIKLPIADAIENKNIYIYINVSHQVVTARFGLIELSKKENVRLIFFCHDLIPIDYPEYVGNQGLEKHSALIKLMLWTGDLIILNSEYSRKSLIDFAKRNAFDIPETQVLHIGNEKHVTNKKWNINDRHDHFYYLATFEPRKNHILLFLAWKKLYSILGEKTPKLLLVGKKGWEIDWLERYFTVEPNVRRFVERKENISDAELENIMLTSYASLNPSYVEGWGLPAVESICMGIPTICSDIPAYHEATQELAIFLSPLDVNVWVNAILKILKNELIFQNNEYIKESWENHFQKLNQLISIVRNKGRAKEAAILFNKDRNSFEFKSTTPIKKNSATLSNDQKVKVYLLKSNFLIVRIIARLFFNKTF